MRLSPAQKSAIAKHKDNSQLPSNLDPNTCPACLKTFKSNKGLNIHKRACKGDRAEELKIKGLEPLFLEWESKYRNKLIVKDKKAWRDGIRRWVLKRIKVELNLGIYAQNPHNRNLEDDSSMHEALYRAGKTIIPCLSGNHDSCLTDSRGCGGTEFSPEYDFLPSKAPLGHIPPQTSAWLNCIVDSVLGQEALGTLVINGKKATTSLVESAHKELVDAFYKGR